MAEFEQKSEDKAPSKAKNATDAKDKEKKKDGNTEEGKSHSAANVYRILRFLYPYRYQAAALLTLTLSMALLATVPPIVSKYLVDEVFTKGNTEHYFLFGFLMVTVFTVYLCIYQFQSMLAMWIGQRFVADLRIKLYDHLLNLSLRYFGKESTGKIVNRLMGDTSTVTNILTGESLGVLSDLVVGTFATIATFAISWRLGFVLFLTIGLFVLNFRMTIKKIIRASRSMRASYDRLSGGVQNRLVTNLAVKTFGTEDRENHTFYEQSADTITFGKAQGVAGLNFSTNVSLINAAGNAIVYFLGCGLVLRGDITYGDVIAFTAYAAQLLWPAVRFSNLANTIQQVAIAADRLFEIFDEPPEVFTKEGAVKFEKLRGEVEFIDMKFHYEPGIEIIKGFTLHVNPGDTIALIGPTGCGKSTILNLIIRYYDITGGRLLLDGMDIDKLDLHCLRKQFGIVLQESHLFSTTIRNNICYSRPYATEEEIISAAKSAEIHDFIMGLDKGYDTPVGDFGVELSVGQKQRINIARAICSDPAILIMDEATSSLDSDSEQAIQRAMDRVLKGRTSFIVAHRLSTIRNATKILLLDKGYVQESGSHEELMQIPNGRYRDLYSKHMGKGVIEE